MLQVQAADSQKACEPHLLESTKLVVLDHLLQAELQVLEQVAQLILVGLLELCALQQQEHAPLISQIHMRSKPQLC